MGVALLLFMLVIPFMSFKKEVNMAHVKNPYLGDWIVESSPVEEIPVSSVIRYFISEDNTIHADVKSTSGKSLAYFRFIKPNHYDYTKCEGKISTNKETRLDFKSSLRLEEQEIEVLCLTKDGDEVGIIKMKK